MSFSNMLEVLQEKYDEKVIFVKSGVFYIATGRDAIFLNKELGLKCVCFKKQICKIGVPENSIKNKGMHKACLDLQKAMKHCKNIWGEYYILKMDVRKYFDNIDKDILFKILKRKIADKKLLWLLKEIIYSNCTREEIENIEIKRKGLPIGNYTSQLFANIYLNEVDQYVKHNLKIKYHFRYLDDSVLFVKTKEEAKSNLKKIKEFMEENLGLELNDKTQIFKSKQGVNFCGYKINEYRLKIRDRGKRKLKNKIKELKYKIKIGEIDSKEAKKYLAGHVGYIHYADSYNLSEKLFSSE